MPSRSTSVTCGASWTRPGRVRSCAPCAATATWPAPPSWTQRWVDEVGPMSSWWRRRTLRSKIAVSATVAAMVFLVLLARLASGAIGVVLVNAADSELRSTLDHALPGVVAGQRPQPVLADAQLRVLDSA